MNTKQFLSSLGDILNFDFFKKLNPELSNFSNGIIARYISLYAETLGKPLSQFHIQKNFWNM